MILLQNSSFSPRVIIEKLTESFILVISTGIFFNHCWFRPVEPKPFLLRYVLSSNPSTSAKSVSFFFKKSHLTNPVTCFIFNGSLKKVC